MPEKEAKHVLRRVIRSPHAQGMLHEVLATTRETAFRPRRFRGFWPSDHQERACKSLKQALQEAIEEGGNDGSVSNVCRRQWSVLRIAPR